MSKPDRQSCRVRSIDKPAFRIQPIRPGAVIEMQTSAPVSLPEHDHNTLLISVLLSSSARVRRRDGERLWRGTLRWGEVGIFPPGLKRQVTWEDEVAIAHLHLLPDLLPPYGGQIDTRGWPMIRDTPRVNDALLRELVLATLGHLTACPTADDLVFDALLDALSLHLQRAHAPAPIEPRAADDDGPLARRKSLSASDVCRLDDYLRANMERRVSVRELAETADVPPRLFSRLFREATGQTPYQYLLGLRLDAAAHLLGQGSGDLASIAVRTGFYDQSHLSRYFTRRFGITPGAAGRRRGGS